MGIKSPQNVIRAIGNRLRVFNHQKVQAMPEGEGVKSRPLEEIPDTGANFEANKPTTPADAQGQGENKG